MSVDVVTEIVIERPRDQVAAFAGDPEMAPAMRRANRKDLARLKSILEAR